MNNANNSKFSNKGAHKIGPVKRTPGRLPRVPFTAEQLSSLENAYLQSSYLSSEEANRLAGNLDLTSTRVSFAIRSIATINI